MTNATAPAPSPQTTILPSEAEHFGGLADDWWNPAGSSAMLHRLNPVRLGFLRAAIDAHWPTGDAVRPLAGKRALDVGCGAGLLCEPLARLGAAVTGIDAAPQNVAAARAHATAMGLTIDYVHADIATLGLTGFDLVTAMEVIEHVADKPVFLAALARSLAPGGLLALSTPNRTTRSRLLLVEGAERIGAIPKGTHHWDEFVTPDELRDLLSAVGLEMDRPQGIAWSPIKGLHLSSDLSLNYIVTARATAAG